MKLYTYFRSSAAYRVRIVLALKKLAWTPIPIHMLRNGGEHHAPAYQAINPQGLIPALDDDGVLTQSIAICEYLEERYPEPALLPSDPRHRAYIRSVMGTVACEIHPLNNLRALKYVTSTLGHSEQDKLAWYRHWIADGFRALEGTLHQAELCSGFVYGDRPTLADAFLVPQVYNARRFDCPLDEFPLIRAIDERCGSEDAFRTTAPEAQPDAA